MTIRKLKSEVTSKLQSGLTIADATQCVLELVENSLDAKATAVAVRIDFNKFILEVVDNGSGISHDDLKLVGKRYMTSKCHKSNDLNKTLLTYGYRGQALASIADISGKLLLKTKCRSSKTTMVKIFKKGISSSIFISNKERSDCGTTVTVHDFMSAMPVRRKRISKIFDLQDMKNQLEYMAFIHNEVCFTLRDENKGEILLQTHRKKNIGLSFAELCGLALDKFLVPFDYKNEFLRVHGYISLKRHSENNLQFFYVNKRIVFKSIVQKLLNRLIDKYFKENDGLLKETPVLQAINLNNPKESHNIYVLQIHCPYTYYEMFKNLRKTTVEFKNWDTVLRSIKYAVKSALKFKSSDTDSENFVEKKLNHRPYAMKKIIVESAIKNGVKGGLAKRKSNQEKNGKFFDNSLGHSRNENFLIHLNNFPANPKEENLRQSTSSGLNEAPKVIPECLWGKNFTDMLKLPETSGVIQSASTDLLKSTKPVDLLSDFIVWFRSKLERDFNALKIYEDFMDYERNSRKRKNNDSGKEGKKRIKIREKEYIEETKEEIHELPSVSNVRNSATSKYTLKTTDEKLNTGPGTVKARLIETKKPGPSERRSKNGNGKKGFGKGGNRSFKTCLNSLSENLATTSSGIDETRTDNWFSHGNRMRSGWKHSKGAPAKEELKTIKKEVSGKTCEQEKEQKFLSSPGKEPDLSHDGVETQTGLVFDGKTEMNEINVESERSNSVLRAPIEGSRYFGNRVSMGNKEGSYENEGLKINAEDVSSSFPTFEPRPSEDINDKLIVSKEADEKEINLELDKDEVISEQLSKMTIVKSASDSQVSEATSCASDGINLEPGNEFKLIINDISNDLSTGADGDKFIAKEDKRNDFVFNLTERYDFIPKGLSPYALGKTPTNYFKTGSKDSHQPGDEDGVQAGPKSLLPSNIIEELREKTEKNMIYYEKELIKATLVKSGSEFLNSFVVDKEMLSNVTIIGQWDKKFIIAKMEVPSSSELKLLVAFDQHAVDERIRLETLLREFRTSDGKFVSTPCNPPVKCSVKESVGRIIPAMESLLIDYGIKISVRDHQTVLFNEIPACLEDKNCSEKTAILVGKLLEDLVEEIRETRGTTASVIPKVLYDLISTRACKGAIQFNEGLSLTKMENMIKDLVLCQSPFQCAHGRPSFIPVLELNAFKTTQLSREEVKLNFKKFNKSV